MTLKEQLTSSSGIRRLVLVAAIAAGFGLAGYFIAPQAARSAALQGQEDLRAQMNEALWARVEAEKQLQQTRQKLDAANQRAAQAAEEARKAKAKVNSVQEFVANLHRRLDQAEQAVKPLREQIAAEKQQAAELKARAEQALGQAEELQVELASARKEIQSLSQMQQRLRARNAGLAKELEAHKRTSQELTQLLSLLELGEGAGAPPAASPKHPGEPPITIWELIYCMGYPSLVFEDDRKQELHWGKKHVVSAIDGIVSAIDGKPASRAALATLGSVQPAVSAPAGQWRTGKGQSLRYADLVAMFGRPERVSGTGSRFTAWWTIGAWAREAAATVVDGIVTEFDGRKTDPAACCALVRHRPEAYRTVTKAVANDSATARACYDLAGKIVAEELRKAAVVPARDGRTLKRWSLAPFDSVGTWIAPTNTPAESIVLRAAVDCTWTELDGTTRREKRFVVITFVSQGGQLRVDSFAMFAPRG